MSNTNGQISEDDYKLAYEEADRILKETKQGIDNLKKFTDKYLNLLQ